jgi:hypothetical protein
VKYQDLVEQITPELYATFRRSLELGRWPDGRTLTPEQRESCLQAVIAYDRLHYPQEERVGYIDRGRKGGEAAQALRFPGETVDDGDSGQ